MSRRRLAIPALAGLALLAIGVSGFSPAPRHVLSPRFNHVMLTVSNLDSSITFYTSAFDLQVTQRIAGISSTPGEGSPNPQRQVKMALLKFPGQEFVLELAERPAGSAGPAPHYQHLGVDVMDIVSAGERVRRAGGRDPSTINTVRTSTGTVAKNMFFRGPSGEMLELMQMVTGEF